MTDAKQALALRFLSGLPSTPGDKDVARNRTLCAGLATRVYAFAVTAYEHVLDHNDRARRGDDGAAWRALCRARLAGRFEGRDAWWAACGRREQWAVESVARAAFQNLRRAVLLAGPRRAALRPGRPPACGAAREPATASFNASPPRSDTARARRCRRHSPRSIPRRRRAVDALLRAASA